MAKFKKIDFQQNEPVDGFEGHSIVKGSDEFATTVADYEFRKIKEAGAGAYKHVKSKMGAIAATDENRRINRKKDSKFALHPMIKGPLGVDDEEKRVINERVESKIQAVIETVRTQAEQRGFRVVLEEGRRQAIEDFKKESRERLANIDRFIDACELAKEEIYRENEAFLIRLVYQISKSILLRDVEVDREYVARLALSLIEKIGTSENIRILINPKDLESIEMLNETVRKKFSELRAFSVEESEEVRIGGCIVESEWSAIDARIETQLKGMEAALVNSESGDL